MSEQPDPLAHWSNCSTVWQTWFCHRVLFPLKRKVWNHMARRKSIPILDIIELRFKFRDSTEALKLLLKELWQLVGVKIDTRAGLVVGFSVRPNKPHICGECIGIILEIATFELALNWRKVKEWIDASLFNLKTSPELSPDPSGSW